MVGRLEGSKLVLNLINFTLLDKRTILSYCNKCEQVKKVFVVCLRGLGKFAFASWSCHQVLKPNYKLLFKMTSKWSEN